ncbi:2815_t:CDS:2 [Diversispora eburnea]|uniref:2815_t:CDS:1 n=1 Tax=Diversispora eburnea TaxID=1213867 RepID=A0A9N8UZW5_9GLOM|nr:2815_t:CDS:2 [Diversispora eburnea]
MSDNVAHAISGGGIISMVLTYPLITISSRLQVQKNNKGRDAIAKILKNEGVGGLYSGLSSAIFGISITNGVYYYFYELTKKFFEKSNKRRGGGSMSVLQSMIAGAIAGSATVIVTNPIWVVNIIKEDGIKSFWQGVIPALILVINPIIQYTAFEQIKAKIEKSGVKLGNLHFFLLGAISKLIATGTTYPYIVIKSRMQLRQSTNARYKSVFDGLQKIRHDEGFSGLYKV